MIKKPIKTITYALALIWASRAGAQTVPDAGSILRDQQKPALELPKPQAPGIMLDEPARPALKPSPTERFELKGFRVSGNTVFAQGELLALLKDYIGKQVDVADLEQAAARISRYYRERGYMVARAYLPVQQIQDGVVEIAVIEGRYGDIKLNNNSRVRDSVVARHVEALRGETVYELRLERKLLLLNDLPGVADARASLSPGAKVGETALTVDVAPAPLFSGSVEFDNHGNRFTGANRLAGRVQVASPLGLGDALSLHASKGFNGLDYGRVAYQVPLGGDGVKVGGAYARQRYELGKTFGVLDASGDSDSYTAEASYPFIRTRNVNLYGRMAYVANDFQDRTGFINSVTDRNTRSVQAALSGDMRDAVLGGGITVFALGASRVRLAIETADARSLDEATARTQGRAHKWNLNLLRLQRVTDSAALYVAVSGQKASKNLDSSEKFVLGGANGVRAYPQGEAAGDSGYLATAELRYSITWDGLPGVLQPFVFADGGSVTLNENPYAAGSNRRNLAGGGAGLSWARSNDFQVKVTLASRLGNQPSVASDTDRHWRGWVQAIKYF